MDDKLQIMELFGPTIQGEGIMTGTVTHFLRTGGCSLRCSWCDSLFAVLPDQIKKYRKMMDIGEIFDAIKALPRAPYVTFTGGDPCLQDRLGDIIVRLNLELDMRVAVETQGMFFPEWLDLVDVITFSPKGPSSGNVVDIDEGLVDWLVDHIGKRSFRVCIKIVCFDQQDYNYALEVYNKIPPQCYDAFYFTAGTPLIDFEQFLKHEDDSGYQKLVEERIGNVLEIQRGLANDMLVNKEQTVFNEKVHLGCQQHVLLWPEQEKGV